MECCGQVSPAHYHCGRCHTSFAALASFDGHLVHEPGTAVITGCLAPQLMGLVSDTRGVWRTPEGLARAQRDKARMDADPRLRRPRAADAPQAR